MPRFDSDYTFFIRTIL